MLLLISVVLAGVGILSWEEGSAAYPADYTPSEITSWSMETDLQEEMAFGGWMASWQEGSEVLSITGLEDGSVCFVENGEQGFREVISPLAQTDGTVVGWGWGSAYEVEPGEEVEIHSLQVTGELVGDGSFSWTAAGWANGAAGPAQPSPPPPGSPWSLMVMAEGSGFTLSGDRLRWEVGADGLEFLQVDVSGAGLPLGAIATITVSWLE